jgi:UDP-glucuronate 4-epimerase
MQPGDVLATFADVADLAAAVGFRPRTRIKCGIRRFIAWYRDYWKASNR